MNESLAIYIETNGSFSVLVQLLKSKKCRYVAFVPTIIFQSTKEQIIKNVYSTLGGAKKIVKYKNTKTYRLTYSGIKECNDVLTIYAASRDSSVQAPKSKRVYNLNQTDKTKQQNDNENIIYRLYTRSRADRKKAIDLFSKCILEITAVKKKDKKVWSDDFRKILDLKLLINEKKRTRKGFNAIEWEDRIKKHLSGISK